MILTVKVCIGRLNLMNLKFGFVSIQEGVSNFRNPGSALPEDEGSHGGVALPTHSSGPQVRHPPLLLLLISGCMT